jgi:probable rRNA maturation factor
MFDIPCSMFVLVSMTRVLSFQNRQRTRALNVPLLRRIARHVLEHELGITEYELAFHLVDATEMAGVNAKFLQHAGSTDVITFDHGVSGAPASGPARRCCSSGHARSETGAPMLHGEIFISVADAVKQAREFRTTWPSEVVRYVIHGVLHLRGYDDLKPPARKSMKQRESHLLRKVAALFPLDRLDKGAMPRRSHLSPHPSHLP